MLRNIFAPILAGGSAVCCAAFDPSLFWSVVQRIGPTYYYASPTMHNLIISSAPDKYDSRFRLICNAAGGLLPSLAMQLQGMFSCTVLPSYGMTECMPISTPPLDYKLDREGTSGISTGPELAILDGNGNLSPNHEIGMISVRGEPVSHGYLLQNGEIDKSAFNENGWFDTGDMGYMDADGYLYITGRSKEVINRGGEIISPFEVENAIMGAAKQDGSPIFGRVTDALAFSAKHDVLQEVVGIVLVTPRDKPRPDLRAVQDALAETLQKAKWPSVIIYMDGVPKGNNKVLRIRVAERTSLQTYTDETPYLERHWEGICPPDNTPLTTSIEARQCEVDLDFIAKSIKRCLPQPEQLDAHIRRNEQQGILELVVAPAATMLGDIPAKEDLDHILVDKLTDKIDNYLIPHRLHVLREPLPRNARNQAVVDVRALEAILRDLQQKGAAALGGSIGGRVVAKFADVLQREPSQIKPEADFFALGGDSLLAGKLIAGLRAEFAVAVPIGMVFNEGTPNAIGRFIEENVPEEDEAGAEKRPSGCTETNSSTRWWLMLIQLIPMVWVYPLRRGFQWTMFMVALTYVHLWPTSQHLMGRLMGLILAIIFAQFCARIVMPLLGLLAKWVIIGKHKEGLYPMWGSYHTRWWLVQKTTDICGYGWFGWSNYTRIVYYRLLGAKIGKNVTMSKVKVGEWDLIEIHDGAVIENCTLRPFGAEWNTTMYLGKITIGRNSSVGTASIVAPGTTVPENTCIGPNSSSWELSAADEGNRDILGSSRPSTHWALTFFVTLPLVFLKWIISLLPWVAGLIGLVIQSPN
ncbi:MAG: AMP-binding protein, partial [Acidobacteria bacterium]|nr:AMP-binding protein [Acidobacteriota bacterium]